MTPNAILAQLTKTDTSDLMVECCKFLDADEVYMALVRGLTGDELDRIQLRLVNRELPED